jgi:hypothetical protein
MVVGATLARINYVYIYARGLAQHGGSPGWLEESDLEDVISDVMHGPTDCLFRTVPVALTGAAQLRAGGIPSCCYIVNVHNPQGRHGLEL